MFIVVRLSSGPKKIATRAYEGPNKYILLSVTSLPLKSTNKGIQVWKTTAKSMVLVGFWLDCNGFQPLVVLNSVPCVLTLTVRCHLRLTLLCIRRGSQLSTDLHGFTHGFDDFGLGLTSMLVFGSVTLYLESYV